MVLLAALLWSTSGFFAKAPLWVDWPVEIRGSLLAAWRASFACLILLPLVRRPRWHPGLIPMAVIFVVMNYTFLTSMTMTTAANAIWLQNTAPVWVFVVGILIWKEPAEWRDWMLLAFGLLGVGTILAFEIHGQSSTGIVMGLLAGLTYAGVVLSLRRLRGENSAWLIALNHVVTAAVLFPLVIHYGIWPTPKQLGFLCAFGTLQMGLPYFLFARGLNTITGHEAAGIVLLEPVLVPVWEFLAWHNAANYDPPRWWTLLGGSFILLGLVVRYSHPRRGWRRRNPATVSRS